jgi:hypothetical protein
MFRARLDGIKTLGVGFFAENNQLFWTGGNTQPASLAALAIYADFAHI